MINKKSVPATSSAPSSNYLSNAVTIEGSYISEHDATIGGTIHGDVHVKGLLKMDKNGYIKGKVKAKSADIAGKVDGVIHCDDTAVLRSTAVINADIHTKGLQVDAEAKIDGKISMMQNGVSARKS
jgi:cytoskeletal protein CcmA (bactofilin family)